MRFSVGCVHVGFSLLVVKRVVANASWWMSDDCYVTELAT